jgi:phenol hydroxylase P5 protein
VGDAVELPGPYGQFFVRTAQLGDLIFIAGGSGLSSPQSMILDLLRAGDTRQIVLFQGVRNRAELYNRELFEALVRDHANFTYVPGLSQAVEDPEWTGFKGLVHDAAKQHFDGRFSANKAYLRGRPPMIDAAVTCLMRVFLRTSQFDKQRTGAQYKSSIDDLYCMGCVP